jgi:uncharacterized coiled-coil DUF342 family protein
MADKFDELESRVNRTIEHVKSLRKQIAALEREVEQMRRERDVVKHKVESLLEMLSELTEETLV